MFEREKQIRAGELDGEIPGYEEITGWFQRVPQTWLGGILIYSVKMCVIRGFFADDEALQRVVAKAIADARNPLSALRLED